MCPKLLRNMPKSRWKLKFQISWTRWFNLAALMAGILFLEPYKSAFVSAHIGHATHLSAKWDERTSMSRHQFVCIHEGVYANPWVVGEERSSAVWNNIVTFIQPRELREWISSTVYFIDLTPDIFISFPAFPIPPRRISSPCRSIMYLCLSF